MTVAHKLALFKDLGEEMERSYSARAVEQTLPFCHGRTAVEGSTY